MADNLLQKRHRKSLGLLPGLFLCYLLFSPAYAADKEEIPAPIRDTISIYAERFLTKRDIDLHIVFEDKSPENPERHDGRLFDSLYIGKKSKAGQGLLVTFTLPENAVRLMPSAGLFMLYPPDLGEEISQHILSGFIEKDRPYQGARAVIELLYNREVGAPLTFSDQPGFGSKDHLFSPSRTAPADSLAAYIYVLEHHEKSPLLPLYSQSTQKLLSAWQVSSWQMDNERRALQKCRNGKVKEKGLYAVIRHSPENRHCAPYFFIKEKGLWRLDLATMQQGIRLDTENRYTLQKGSLRGYEFAFEDWSLDKNGYPIARQWP